MSSDPPHGQAIDTQLNEMWNEIANDIAAIDPGKVNWKSHLLPLARVKKIMKSEEAVFQELERERMERESADTKGAAVDPNTPTRFMIAGDAPLVMEKACEIIIRELTVRAWRHTERNRRRTLQRNDVHAAVGESEMFDFLIDLVPRISPPAPAPPAVSVPIGSVAAPPPRGPPTEVPEQRAAQEQQQQPPAEPQAAMNLSEAETQYAQLQEMQGQMQEHYMMMQQRVRGDGAMAQPGTTEAAADGQQPQVVLNPQFMIHPPEGEAMPQWPAPDEANPMPNPDGTG